MRALTTCRTETVGTWWLLVSLTLGVCTRSTAASGPGRSLSSRSWALSLHGAGPVPPQPVVPKSGLHLLTGPCVVCKVTVTPDVTSQVRTIVLPPGAGGFPASVTATGCCSSHKCESLVHSGEWGSCGLPDGPQSGPQLRQAGRDGGAQCGAVPLGGGLGRGRGLQTLSLSHLLLFTELVLPSVPLLPDGLSSARSYVVGWTEPVLELPPWAKSHLL